MRASGAPSATPAWRMPRNRSAPGASTRWRLPMPADARVSVVVLTHDRPCELARTITELRRLPERPRIVVVDNASRAGVVEAVLHDMPDVERVRSAENRRAPGRHSRVARGQAPHLRVCGGDTAWGA